MASKERDDDHVLEVLIVEDEFSYAVELKMLVEQLGYKCMGIVDNGKDALTHIKKNVPGAILMDIDLKGKMNGLELAEKTQHLKIPTLFITSHTDEQTYEKANMLNHIGFLVKPLSEFTLLSALDACLKNIDVNDEKAFFTIINDAILVKKGKLYYKIVLDDIILISSELEYLTLYTEKGQFTIRETLKTMMSTLIGRQFFKCHQRHIINTTHLESIDMENGIANLKLDMSVPVSRRQRKILLEGFTAVI